MSSPLPRPITTAEYYLKAIYTELQQLNDGLERLNSGGGTPLITDTEPENAVVELREPAPSPIPVKKATPIPSDFPGRAKLHAAGIVTLEAVPRDLSKLKSVRGIGTKLAERIMEQLP
jgi:hypothetical protein